MVKFSNEDDLQESVVILRQRAARQNQEQTEAKVAELCDRYNSRAVLERPGDYVVLACIQVVPAPTHVSLIWVIGAPGPYDTAAGKPCRRLVRTLHSVVLGFENGQPKMGGVDESLGFSDYRDAAAFAGLLTLGQRCGT